MDIRDIKPDPLFTAEGHGTYVVRLNVIGIMNDIYICAPGNSVEEAEECALETMGMLKNNDMEVMQTTKV
jgi:hypothetical protein